MKKRTRNFEERIETVKNIHKAVVGHCLLYVNLTVLLMLYRVSRTRRETKTLRPTSDAMMMMMSSLMQGTKIKIAERCGPPLHTQPKEREREVYTFITPTWLSYFKTIIIIAVHLDFIRYLLI
jgi:hypothetical protein